MGVGSALELSFVLLVWVYCFAGSWVVALFLLVIVVVGLVFARRF